MLKNIVLLFILMLSSCSMDRKVSDKVSIMLDVPVSPIKTYFKEHFDFESFIAIETTDSFLVSDIKKIVRSDDNILLLSGNRSVFLIDAHSGKLKVCIDKCGNGPGESKRIIDIAFNEELGQILLYNDFYKLLVFDLKGDFLSEVKVGEMYENVTCRRGEVLFYNKLNGYSCYPYMLKIYNLKNKTWRTVGDDIKIDFPIRSRGLQMVNSKRVWFNAPLDYKLYCFEDDTPAAHYQLDISMAKLSDDLIKKSISDPQTFFNEVSMGKIVYSLNSLRETENFLIFHSNQTGLFLFDKKENKLYVDEFLMDDIFYINSGDYYPHEGDDNSVMFLLTADRWINHPELMSGLPTEWRNKANALNIKEDDNPILCLFKFEE